MVAFRHNKEFVKCEKCGHEYERSAVVKHHTTLCVRCLENRRKKH